MHSIGDMLAFSDDFCEDDLGIIIDIDEKVWDDLGIIIDIDEKVWGTHNKSITYKVKWASDGPPYTYNYDTITHFKNILEVRVIEEQSNKKL